MAGVGRGRHREVKTMCGVSLTNSLPPPEEVPLGSSHLHSRDTLLQRMSTEVQVRRISPPRPSDSMCLAQHLQLLLPFCRWEKKACTNGQAWQLPSSSPSRRSRSQTQLICCDSTPGTTHRLAGKHPTHGWPIRRHNLCQGPALKISWATS